MVGYLENKQRLSLTECEGNLPGLRLRASFWGMIWMTSYWDSPLELRGMFCRTEMLLLGFSTKRGSHPLFCKFCMKSQRDVSVFPLPKS